MSIKTIITRGFGNGTFLGTIKDIVLRGFSIPPVIVPTSANLEYSVNGYKLDYGLESNKLDYDTLESRLDFGTNDNSLDYKA